MCLLKNILIEEFRSWEANTDESYNWREIIQVAALIIFTYCIFILYSSGNITPLIKVLACEIYHRRSHKVITIQCSSKIIITEH